MTVETGTGVERPVQGASGGTRRGSRLRAYAPILLTAALLALVPLRYHESGSTMRLTGGSVSFCLPTRNPLGDCGIFSPPV